MVNELVGFGETVSVEVVRAHRWFWEGWLAIIIIIIILIIIIRRRSGVKPATAVSMEDKNENSL